jgi:hypothetical protein
MKGNTLAEFMDDLLSMGGPEKEFVFRDRFFFLESAHLENGAVLELYLDEYDNSNPQEKVFLTSHRFLGKNLTECVEKFENATIFDGLTIYQAEKEIEVLFG